MENPISAQRNAYGKDGGPPMLYTAEPSLIFPDQPTWKPPRRKKKVKNEDSQPSKSQSAVLHDLHNEVRKRRDSGVNEATQLSPCQLPGDFPPELAYRALATYSLLRTLSAPLRLSPFTPIVFLRALYLPAHHKLLGDIHVALLRILLPHLQLGYSYKETGGGVGVFKRRHIDNVRWPLRAGDNLTHLDALTWPIFYDDYCHLTADRLWESYHGGQEDTTANSRFIDFRSLGLSDLDLDYEEGVSPQKDSDAARPSRNGKTHVYREAEEDHDENDYGRENVSNPPKPVKKRGRPPKKIAPNVQDDGRAEDDFAGDSEMEEYQDEPDRDSDDDDEWGRPISRRKRRRRNQKTTMELSATAEPPSKVSSSPLRPKTLQRRKKESEEVAANTMSATTNGSKVLSVEYAEPVAPGPPTSTSDDGTIRIRGGGAQEGEADAGDTFSRPRRSRGLPMHNQSLIQQQQHQQQLQFIVNMAATQRFGAPEQQNAALLLQNQRQHLLNAMGQQLLLQQHLQHSTQMAASMMDSRPNNPFHLQQSHKVEVEDPYVVSDSVAASLQAFISDNVVDDNTSENNSTTAQHVLETRSINGDAHATNSRIDDDFTAELYASQWKHFKPVERMRAGVPYHRLALEHKLGILEFLTDELMQMEAFSALFSERHANADSIEFPYGSSPTQEELENLQNEDECGVCRQEGDLLCCDGCINSYHKECLGMKVDQELGDGQWLCPECQLVDPSMLGPLHGGKKGTLEWFRLEDLQVSLNKDGVPAKARSDKVAPRAERAFPCITQPQTAIPGESIISRNESQHTEGNPSSKKQGLVKSSNEEEATYLEFGKLEFLVVHGYIFCRSRSRTGETSLSPVSILEEPYLPLRGEELKLFLSRVGVEVSNAWPLSQIPRPFCWSSAMSVSQYLFLPSRSDPCLYDNQYQSAPINHLTKAGGVTQVTRLQELNYDKTCYKTNNTKLSEVLSRDLSIDKLVKECLICTNVLVDPFQLVIGYLVELENSLHRGCMIDTSWDGGEFVSRRESWTARVRATKSIAALAKLLLKLVNEANPRVFEEHWFHNPHTKTLDPNTAFADRTFRVLSEDWSIDKEIVLRKWQIAPPNLILSLCSKDGSDLSGFAAQIRSDTFVPKPRNAARSKRKPRKTADATSSSDTNMERVEREDSSPADGKSCSKPEIQESNFNDFEDRNLEKESSGALRLHLASQDGGSDEAKPRIDTTSGDSSEEETRANVHKGGAAETMKIAGDELSKNVETEVSTDHVLEGEVSAVGPRAPTTAECRKSDPVHLAIQSSDMSSSNNKTIIAGVEKSGRSKSPDLGANSTKAMPSQPSNHRKCEEGDQTISTGFAHSRALSEGYTNDCQVSRSSNDRSLNKSDTALSDQGGISTVYRVDNELRNNTSPSMKVVEQDDSVPDSKDNATTNEVTEGSNQKQPKKRQKNKKSGNASKRNTRRSGRLAVTSPDQSQVLPTDSESHCFNPPSDLLDGMSLQIENAKKRNLPSLEKLAKGLYVSEGIWPIAGRLIFPTVGDLSRREMKRLARRGGTLVAADLAYHTSHEVAQVSIGHIWRKRIASCSEFEELILLIRILESSLDRQSMHSSELATKRAKSGTQKMIRCSLRNPSTGKLDHFVVNKKKMKGCWMSNNQVDVSSLVCDLFERRMIRIQARLHRIREKQKKDFARQQALRLEDEKKALLEKRRLEAEAIDRAAKLRKLQEEQQKMREEAAQQKAAAMLAAQQKTAAMLAARQKEQQLKLMSQQAGSQPANLQNMQPHSSNHAIKSDVQAQVAQLNQNIHMVLNRHGEKFRIFLQEASRGGKIDPQSEIQGMRQKTLAYLRSFTMGLRQCNAPVGSEETLSKLIFEKERLAVQSVNQSIQHNPRNTKASAAANIGSDGTAYLHTTSSGPSAINAFEPPQSSPSNRSIVPPTQGINPSNVSNFQFNVNEQSIAMGTGLTQLSQSFGSAPLFQAPGMRPYRNTLPDQANSPFTPTKPKTSTMGEFSVDMEPAPIKEFHNATPRSSTATSSHPTMLTPQTDRIEQQQPLFSHAGRQYNQQEIRQQIMQHQNAGISTNSRSSTYESHHQPTSLAHPMAINRGSSQVHSPHFGRMSIGGAIDQLSTAQGENMQAGFQQQIIPLVRNDSSPQSASNHTMDLSPFQQPNIQGLPRGQGSSPPGSQQMMMMMNQLLMRQQGHDDQAQSNQQLNFEQPPSSRQPPSFRSSIPMRHGSTYQRQEGSPPEFTPLHATEAPTPQRIHQQQVYQEQFQHSQQLHFMPQQQMTQQQQQQQHNQSGMLAGHPTPQQQMIPNQAMTQQQQQQIMMMQQALQHHQQQQHYSQHQQQQQHHHRHQFQ